MVLPGAVQWQEAGSPAQKEKKDMPHFESDEDFFNALDNGPEAAGFKHRKRPQPASSTETAEPQDDDIADFDPDEEP